MDLLLDPEETILIFSQCGLQLNIWSAETVVTLTALQWFKIAIIREQNFLIALKSTRECTHTEWLAGIYAPVLDLNYLDHLIGYNIKYISHCSIHQSADVTLTAALVSIYSKTFAILSSFIKISSTLICGFLLMPDWVRDSTSFTLNPQLSSAPQIRLFQAHHYCPQIT